MKRIFRRQFNVGRHGRVPSRNTILTWVKKCEETGSVFAVKHGAPRTVRMPENLQREKLLKAVLEVQRASTLAF